MFTSNISRVYRHIIQMYRTSPVQKAHIEPVAVAAPAVAAVVPAEQDDIH